MKQIACCQPHYIPWIGYFEMIDRVDEFWFLDDVDFIKREWKNRNRIRKDRTGAEVKWLTVPIERASQRGTHIAAAKLASDVDWRRRHLDAFRHVYRHAPFFTDALELLEAGFARTAATLGDLNVALLIDLCRYLGIETALGCTSSLGASGHKTEKLIGVCRAVGATGYLANNGSAGYLRLECFADERIACAFQDYEHPTYEQRSQGALLPFVSHLSVLDLIANQGADSLELLRQGGRVRS